MTAPPPADPPGATSGRGRRWEFLAVALGASWLLPAVLDAVSLDVLLIPVFVLAIAAVLRTGGVLLDRLVVATLVLCGGVLALGLLQSVWPWGMAPLPVSGVILSTISLVAWLARRAPRLPWRFRPSDLVILGTGAAAWHYVHHPMIGRSVTDRLPFILSVEDRFIHFGIFDGIHQLGGYLFLHQEPARALVATPTEAVYPQGSHFLLAWFDIFVRSNTHTGDVLSAYNRYYLYVLASFAVLFALIVWGARWIAGPRLTGWRTAAVLTAVAGVVTASALGGLVRVAFDSQITGLVFMVVAVALLIRPAMDLGSYAAVSVAGLVTVGYAYNILCVYVGLAMVAGAVVYRARQRRHRWALYGVQAAGGAVAILPSLISLTAPLDPAAQAQAPGMYVMLDRSLMMGLFLLVPLVALLPANRRTGVGRMTVVIVAGGVLAVMVFGAWQKSSLGYLSYYFEKLANGGLVVCLMGLGLLGGLLRPNGPAVKAFRKGWWSEAVVSVAVAAAGLSLFAGVQWGVPSVGSKPSTKANPGVVKNPTDWQKTDLGQFAQSKGADTGTAYETLLNRDLKRVDPGVPLVALYTSDPYINWKTSFFASTLVHQGGRAHYYYGIFDVSLGGKPEQGKPPMDDQHYQAQLAKLKKALAEIPAREVAVLVGDQETAAKIRKDLATFPDQKIDVLDAPLIS